MTQTGVRSGILLAVIGLFVLLRTVNQDQSGRTLIDHILGPGKAKAAAAAPAAASAFQAVAPKVTALTPGTNVAARVAQPLAPGTNIAAALTK